MIQKNVCIVGGTGFVGHQLASELARAGFHIRIPSRNRERRRSIFVLPNVEVVDTDIHDQSALNALFEGCDVVINLAAILNAQGKDTFTKLHVDLPRKIVSACKASGVARLIHMSALNADADNGSSEYLRSKGEGEKIVMAAADELAVTVFRPSVMFGNGDRFFNTFALMMTYLPAIPAFCADARLAPIYVGDVTKAMRLSLNDHETFGQRYDLCGPETFTMLGLMEYAARQVRRKRKIIPLGSGMSALAGKILGLLPGKVFTYDNYLSLQTAAVCHPPIPAHFNIEPTRLDAVVPKYIGETDIRGRYDEMRMHAGRDPEPQ